MLLWTGGNYAYQMYKTFTETDKIGTLFICPKAGNYKYHIFNIFNF